MPYELAEKLTRSGHEPQARPLWQQARAGYPDDVWIYVQARVEFPAALSPRSTRAGLGRASGRRPAPSSCPGTPGTRD